MMHVEEYGIIQVNKTGCGINPHNGGGEEQLVVGIEDGMAWGMPPSDLLC